MGLGDWIMASADVRCANEATGKKVLIGDGKRVFTDPQIFANNPRMAHKDDPAAAWVPNYPGNRPYLKAVTGKRMLFNEDYRPEPGEIFLSTDELRWADKNAPEEPFIVVEPNVNPRYVHTVNKAWVHWDELLRHDLPFVQLGDVNAQPKARHVITPSFRQALAMLSKASLFVGTDGALHHAAAALGIPAVVIWTGFTSPRHLGYAEHVNIHDGSEPCGTYSGVCQHCRKKAEAILPEQVLSAIRSEFEKR